MKKCFKKNEAFTLIEMLIAISVFIVLLIIATNSFLGVMKVQGDENEKREIYSDLRNFIDLLNDEVRNGKIDYFCYKNDSLSFEASSLTRCSAGDRGNVGEIDNVLRIISSDGFSSSTIWADKNDEGKLTIKIAKYRKSGVWELERGYDDDGKEILFKEMEITKLKFEILPKVEPGTGTEIYHDISPIVMVNLAVEGQNNFRLDFQTAITTRSY